jgi:hypothetical protein
MVDGRAVTGPTQLATAPGSAPDVVGGTVLADGEPTGTALVGATLAGAELGGTALVGAAVAGFAVPGAAVAGVAMGVADAEGGVGADVGEVVGGDVDDNARGVAAAETEGMLDVGLPFGEHAVKASASPSTAPAVNFPKK